jgi:hypothetical protein
LKCKTIRSALLSALPSTYDDFLYAPVGESVNGALLTVLSVLARQNVDPWEEAADLSRMPHDTATQRLISMITASPSQPSNANQTAVADRLIGLLQRRIVAGDVIPNARAPVSQAEPAAQRSPPPVNLMVIAIYIGVMVLGQWLAASIFEKAPADVASAPSLRSTPGETLESTTANGKTNEIPR